MPFKSGLELTELQNMTVPEDDNISNDSNDFTEVENGQINSKFISDRESRRSLTNSHLEKKKCDEYIPGTTSLRMSVFNLSNAIMGSGILGLAFALANTGIILFVFLLTSVTFLSIYSINLLLICSKETGCMVYEKLGEQVFGTPGKMIVFGSTSLQNTGAMLSYLFIVKNELPSAIKFLMGKEEAFSRTQKRMQMVSNTSFFAMFVMYFMTAIFGYLTFYDNVHSDLLHNYQSRDDILILTVRVAVIFAVILTVPVLFFTVRSSLFELAKKTKYDLCRHVVVTLVLLVIINLLVIFIPSMKDIFGVVDSRRLDSFGIKMYSSLSFQLWVANHQALLGQYEFNLWGSLPKFEDSLQDHDRKEFKALVQEGTAAARTTLQAALDAADMAVQSMASAVSMRWASWVLLSGLSSEAQTSLQDLQFDGKALFAERIQSCMA
ncbi:Sodium-coupled neutral amino acid transporter 1 [Chelonia mydas]|uniref:Sodium-coupled neutral amino acid transporter 1 n=1 Tax=Chelonia mydas TaxID=8469 RepID=M7BIP4_CHEMY|nr:Sodium-coupled neutral amino acid transporter 1 [Chelonia mydas]